MKILQYMVLVLFGISVSSAQENRGVVVRPNTTELVQSEPKKTVTTVFRVTNTSESRRTFIADVGLPENWRLISQEFPFTLEPQQTEIRIVSFFIPQNVPAGVYEVSYWVRDREYPSRSDYYALPVQVLQYRHLFLRMVEVPRSILGGESYRVTVLLQNESNVADTVELKAESASGYPIALHPSRVFLERGQSTTVTAVVQSEAKSTEMVHERFQIFTKFLHDPNWIASQSIPIHVIPRLTKPMDRFHRIPVQIVFSEAMQSTNHKMKSGFQGEIYGEGQLVENSDKKIEFRFRGPDIYQTSIYGQHDEYVIGYQSKPFAFYVGDRTYSLTTLTENARYARGVEAISRWRNMELAGFVQKTRWYTPQEKEAGGYVRYNLPGKGMWGIGMLSKSRDGETGNLVTMHSQLDFWKQNPIQLEAVLGNNHQKQQMGYYAKWTGNSKRLYYYLNLIYTDPDFPGYYKNTRLFTLGGSITLKENLRIHTAWRYERQKYMVDTMLYVAPLSFYARLGVNYRFLNGTSLLLDLVRESREDRYPQPRFNYETQYVRLSLSKGFEKMSVNGAFDLGQTENKLSHKKSVSYRLNTGVHYVPNVNQSVQVFADFDNTERYALKQVSRLTLGTHLSWKIREETQLRFHFQNAHSVEQYYFDRDLFELQISQKVFHRDEFTLRARRTLLRNSMDHAETAVLLDYRVKWGIPVAYKKHLGVVSGRIYDAETSLPLKDVVVRINGSSAVSNGQGEFIFPALKPGTYYLRVDPASIGLDRITARPTPMAVTIRGADRYTIDLPVTRSASFVGEIVLCKTGVDSVNGNAQTTIYRENGEYAILGNGKTGNGKNGNGRKDCEGLAGILIEIKKEDEVFRRVTDAKGQFAFEELRPGKWTVKLYPQNLPEHHRFEKETFEIELKPGERFSQKIYVFPKKRRIQILEEGGTLIEEKVR